MPKAAPAAKTQRRKKVIEEEQIHYNYFDNVHSHIKKLGDTYLAKIAGTSSIHRSGPQRIRGRRRGRVRAGVAHAAGGRPKSGRAPRGPSRISARPEIVRPTGGPPRRKDRHTP